MPNEDKICWQTSTSSVLDSLLSGVRDTLIVSPIPLFISIANAEADDIIASRPNPASVNPKCSGYLHSVDKDSYISIKSDTLLVLQEMMIFSGFRPSAIALSADVKTDLIRIFFIKSE